MTKNRFLRKIKTHRSYFLTLVILVSIVKGVLFFNSGNSTLLNPDEYANYQVAQNIINGLGHTFESKLTCYNNGFTLMVYKFLILNDISIETYTLFIHSLSILLYALSYYGIRSILKIYGLSDNLIILTTAFYAVYPSNLYYIGNLFLYENLSLPILVISFTYFLKAFHESSRISDIWPLYFLVPFSMILRPQTIIIYTTVLGCFGLFFLIKKGPRFSIKKTLIVSGLYIISFLFFIPILKKNHSIFGKYIISTQAGYELMQGHCDLARGSWYGNWSSQDSPYYVYSQRVIPNLDHLNEYEEGEARKDFALSWIKNNPLQETFLILKKTAIFFLPKNFNSGYHLINIITHLMFFVSVISFFWRYKRLDSKVLLLFSPILASLLLSIIFFVGFRWRFYAEPFFILIIAFAIDSFKSIVKESV